MTEYPFDSLTRDQMVTLVDQAPEVETAWEPVKGRYVECDQKTPMPVPGVCSTGGTWSTYLGRHSHWQAYDIPHRRLILRLPAVPVTA